MPFLERAVLDFAHGRFHPNRAAAAGRLRWVVDFDALEAAGIANARERAALIEYLDGLGFTAEEMVEAERRGRLFGLAGDALQRSGPPDLQPARRPPMRWACRLTTSQPPGPCSG